MATFTPFTADQAPKIASYAAGDEKHRYIEIGQTEHRLHLINFWQIPPGARVLEIGCGQGTTTSVLASIVGPNGHVDAVDPASPDYGAPFTLGQAQAHLSATEIGPRITWHNADPAEFLAGGDAKWDYVVFAHCIWYFDSPEVLEKMLSALKGRAANLLVAEYALKATKRDAEAHVLAAIARASLEAHNKDSNANIRCLLGPNAIRESAEKTGWAFQGEDNVVPEVDLLDGSWEVGDVKGKHFVGEIDEHIQDDRVKTMLKSSRDAVIAAAAKVEAERPLTMDVWVSKFN